MNQQQKNRLPRRQVPIFDGNPLSYGTFMRAFETVVESNESDSGGRLYYLGQHTSGRAREILRSCMYLNPEEGYSKAKKLLEARFGQKHNIAKAYIDQLMVPISKPRTPSHWRASQFFCQVAPIHSRLSDT